MANDPAIGGANPDGAQLSHDGFGQLNLVDPRGVSHRGVVPIRSFPLSAPEEWIIFVDAAGREVWAVEHLDRLSPSARAATLAELTARELLPVIQAIHDISQGAEPSEWRVSSDRGEVSFLVPAEENVRALPDGGALITDLYGIRYRVLKIDALPKHSQRLLSRYI